MVTAPLPTPTPATFDIPSFRSSSGLALADWQRWHDRRGRTEPPTWQLRTFALELRAAMTAAIGPGATLAACRVLGVTRATLSRWTRLPAPVVETQPVPPAVVDCSSRESAAIRVVYSALDRCSQDERRRVVALAHDRYVATAGGYAQQAAQAPLQDARPPWDYQPQGVDTSDAARVAAVRLAEAFAEPGWSTVDDRSGMSRLEIWAEGGARKPPCNLECGGRRVIAPGSGSVVVGACPRVLDCDKQVRRVPEEG